MAKLPPVQRFSMESFSTQSSWIGALIDPLNLFMEQVVGAFNRNLTIADNFAGTMLTVTLDGTFPYKLAWTLKQKPISVVVGNTTRTDGASFTLTSAVQVQWQYNQDGQFQIDGVVGITPTSTTKYNVLLEIKTG